MGARGPRPQPTKLRLLKGNPGKRKVNTREPQPKAVKTPACPDWLGPHGQREWKRVTKELCASGVITAVDLGALSALCHAYDRAMSAGDELRARAAALLQMHAQRTAKHDAQRKADAAAAAAGGDTPGELTVEEIVEQLPPSSLTAYTPNGFIQTHPLVTIEKTFWAEYRRWCQEFGMTPSSRSRVQVPESKEKDGLEALLG